MDGIKHFLTVACLIGCGSGGGGGAGMPDGGDAQTGDGGPGSDGSGVQASGNDHCANAFAISLATTHTDIAANPAGAGAELAAPCGAAGTPDVFFKFTLTRRELVYADTFGASSNTTLFFASSCTAARTGSTTPGDAVCSTGACGTGQSQVMALLGPGTHYLVLAGQGAATIHFQHAEVGNGTVEYLAQGMSAPTGATSGAGTLYECLGSGAENAYWWQTCPGDAGGAFSASTCTGTDPDFDTSLSLQSPGTDEVFCNDDACSIHSSLSANIPAGAALYVIAVDSSTLLGHGNYTLTTSRP
jgi:hypothetical protein